jgi:spermidine/putrescine transport system substrate-binding protein
MIIRTALCSLALFLTGCLCSSPTQSGANAGDQPASGNRVVNLAIWSNFITEEMIAEFTAQTGIKVQITNYSSNEELLAKLQAGATGYDVAVPSDYMVQAMAGLGLIERLDRNQLPNFAGLDPRLLGKEFDRQNDVSIPYGYSLTGLATNSQIHPAAAQSWADLLTDPAVAGKITMLDDVRESLGAALKLRGFSLNSVNEAELNEAKSILVAAKPRIKAFTSEPIEGIMNGEFAVAHMYSSDALQARAQSNGKVQFAVPKEGTTLALDNLVIPKGASNLAEAHALINYLISPSANVKIVQSLFLGPVVLATRDALPDSLKSDPVLFPSEEVLQRCEMMRDLGDDTTKYDRIWTEIKASQG